MPVIAIIGASNDHRKYGHAAVLAFLAAGWTVFPVNPNETRIAGLDVVKSVEDISSQIDWISLYVPPVIGLKLLSKFCSVGAEKIWLNPGSESPALLAEAASLKLSVICGCSIRAIGQDPANFFHPWQDGK